jgi:nicotinamidase-related amidase
MEMSSTARMRLGLVALSVVLVAPLGSAGEVDERSAIAAPAVSDSLGPTFFDHAVFVSIDFQPPIWRDEPLPEHFAELGITREDVEKERRYLVEEALPNARRVADVSRKLGIPLIFVHWGYLFEDGMDLEPPTYDAFMDHYGPDTSKWPHHISAPDSRPAEELGVRRGEYVIAKTAQDAFVSSNIANVLTNLGARSIVFVGGDTGACLGRSARSAISAGYEVLCVKDASFDVSEARRLETFEQIGCHHVVSTEEFEQLVERALESRSEE